MRLLGKKILGNDSSRSGVYIYSCSIAGALEAAMVGIKGHCAPANPTKDDNVRMRIDKRIIFRDLIKFPIKNTINK